MRLAPILLVIAAVGTASGQAPRGKDDGKAGRSKPAAVYTEHDRLREVLEYNRASLAGAYAKHGKHGPWDKEAAEFLDQVAVYFTYSSVGAQYRDVPTPDAEELRVGAAALIALGCDDPLVHYCHGSILHVLGREPEATEQLEKSIPALEALGYPPHRVFAAARRLERIEPGSGVSVKAGQVVDRVLEQLAVGPLDRVARRQVYGAMFDGLERLPIAKRVEIIERLRMQDGVDPWVLDVTDGQLHLYRAWASRGEGTADTVTDAGWQGFYDHLAQARECLTRAWKLAPDLPEAPSAMIDVAMGAGDRLNENVMTWFERAEAAQFDHVNAYARMWNALRPRWGGSHEEMYELGLRAMRTGRYDTLVPWQLVVAVSRIGEDTGEGWDILASRPEMYGQLCKVDDGYVAALAKRNEDVWFRTHRAGLAWRAGKLDEARKQLDKLGDEWDPSAFADLGSRNPPAAVGQIYARTGPQAAAVKRGEAAMAAEDWAGALRAFEAAQAALGKRSGRAAPYFQQRVTLLGRRVALAEGREAVNVQPDASLTSWKTSGGVWRVGPDGAVMGSRGGQKYCALLLDEPLGHRFEIAGSAKELKHDSPPVILICEGERDVVQIVFFGGGVMLATRGDRGRPMNFPGAGPDFVVRLDGDKLTIARGGKDVAANVQLPPSVVPRNPRIGLSVLNDIGEAAFSDLTVRRITGNAPAPKAAPADGDGLD